jgi:glycosyltransferase involved in cell wall biosynthesis
MSTTVTPTPTATTPTSYPHKLGALIMMRNEQDTILITLSSVVDTVDCVVVYDTGSTDKTLELVQGYCTAHKLPLYITRGVFVDFSTSRNVLIDYAEPYCEYQLHLDSADKLMGGAQLKQFVRAYSGAATSFMVFQQWFMGKSSIRFRNLRLVKSGFGYRYKCRVHEMLIRPGFDSNVDTVGIDTKFDERPEATNNPDGSTPLSGFVIFQNRTLDNTKTLHRFQRDAVMLYDDWLSDPEETRTLFYLGQTYDHMGDPQRGYLWYHKRVERATKGFNEEVLHAHMRLGKMAQRLGLSDAVAEAHLWDCVQFSMRNWGRVLLEPVLLLVQIMDSRQEFAKAFHLLNSVMNEPYPVSMNLFVDATAYKYARYHWMGRVAWYVGQFVVGGWNAILAHRVGNAEVDLKNVQVYLDSGQSKDSWTGKLDQVHYLIRTCPSIQAFEQAWHTGEMKWPDVTQVGSDVNTSALVGNSGVESSFTHPTTATDPKDVSSTQGTLTSKQKIQHKLQQQRLMRKAK